MCRSARRLRRLDRRELFEFLPTIPETEYFQRLSSEMMGRGADMSLAVGRAPPSMHIFNHFQKFSRYRAKISEFSKEPPNIRVAFQARRSGY